MAPVEHATLPSCSLRARSRHPVLASLSALAAAARVDPPLSLRFAVRVGAVALRSTGQRDVSDGVAADSGWLGAFDAASVASFDFVGLLIHAAVGGAATRGVPFTNRSGCAAYAASSTRCRSARRSWLRP